MIDFPLDKSTMQFVIENFIRKELIRELTTIFDEIGVKLIESAVEKAKKEQRNSDPDHSRMGDNELFIHLCKKHSREFAGYIIRELQESGFNIYERENLIIIIPGKEGETLPQILALLEKFEEGTIWVDKHFDREGLDYINRFKIPPSLLIGPGKIDNILKRILINLIENKKIQEVRVLSDEDSQLVHDRLLISEKMGFVVPPVNLWGKKFSLFVQIDPAYVQITRRFIKMLWSKSTKIENYNIKVTIQDFR